MGIEGIIENFQFEPTIAADFRRFSHRIFFTDRKKHFTCGGFFRISDPF